MAGRKPSSYSITIDREELNSERLAGWKGAGLELSELGQPNALLSSDGLRTAVREGSLEKLKEQLDLLDEESELDALDRSGFSVLHEAARSNHLAIVETLLDRGARIDVRSRKDQLTPLHVATRWVRSGSLEVDRCESEITLRSFRLSSRELV